RGEAPDIVRIVEGLSGRVSVGSELVIRFGYGSVLPTVRRVGDALVAMAGPDSLAFRTSAQTRSEDAAAASSFGVSAGELVAFALTWFPTGTELPAAVRPERALHETEKFWRNWTSRCTYDGPYREEVLGSLIVLKGLTYLPTGGIIAAPTTSLPEGLHNTGNWDYRYCWLRDATLTLLAFLRAGYLEEAGAWRAWLLRVAADDPDDLQIMYGVDGRGQLPERVIDWLPGFEGSRPVRIGNAAAGQQQIDVYGEITDAFYQARKHDLVGSLPIWEFGRHMLAQLEQRWREP